MEKDSIKLFPEPITRLPEADIPVEGINAFLSQSETHQIIFMHFQHDIELPEHTHNAQVGFVVDGNIDLTVNGIQHSYSKGDMYHIPKGAPHSAKIYAGYADITFFDEPNRYAVK